MFILQVIFGTFTSCSSLHNTHTGLFQEFSNENNKMKNFQQRGAIIDNWTLPEFEFEKLSNFLLTSIIQFVMQVVLEGIKWTAKVLVTQASYWRQLMAERQAQQTTGYPRINNLLLSRETVTIQVINIFKSFALTDARKRPNQQILRVNWITSNKKYWPVLYPTLDLPTNVA